MDIAFRVSSSYDSLTDFITKLSEVSEKVIIYQHDATRIHIHGLVQDCRISTDTMKNWIKKCLNVKSFPKSDWSFKSVDDDYGKYITYMSKGKLSPMYVKEFDDEFVEQCRNEWVDYVKSSNPVKTSSDKPTIYQIAQEVHNNVLRLELEKQLPIDRTAPDGYVLYAAHLDQAIKVCHKYRQPFEEHYLRRLVITAMTLEEKGVKSLMRKMMEKEFPSY